MSNPLQTCAPAGAPVGAAPSGTTADVKSAPATALVDVKEISFRAGERVAFRTLWGLWREPTITAVDGDSLVILGERVHKSDRRVRTPTPHGFLVGTYDEDDSGCYTGGIVLSPSSYEARQDVDCCDCTGMW